MRSKVVIAAFFVTLYIILNTLKPQIAYAQTITLSPISGSVGSSVTVTGSGFLMNKQVIIYWDLTTQVGNATTSSTGTFKIVFAVPSSTRGSHTIQASDGTNSPTATFTVTSSLSRSPTSGVVGTTITLTGYGYLPLTTITIKWDGATLASSPSIVTTDNKGAFMTTVLAPPGEPVSHDIVASDASGSVTATFTLSRTIVLSSNSGPIGTVVLVTGSGYLESNPIIIAFDGSPVSTTPASVISDSLGGFVASFSIPSSSPGAHKVRATDNIGGWVEATFTVTPSITISPNNGRGGTAVTVTGTGFAPLTLVTIQLSGAAVINAITDSSGGFSASFPIPPKAAGIYTISATDAIGTVATANFQVTPLISITPSSGTAGTIVTVTGAGFTSNSIITIFFAGSQVSTTPAIILTDTYGGFIASLTISSTSTGSWSLLAVDSSNLRSATTFSVNRKLSLSTTSPGSGTNVIARGTSFAPNSQVVFTFDGAILVTSPSTVFTDVNGRFNASLTIPESTQGSHVIVANDSTGYPVSVTITVNDVMTLSPTSGNLGTVVNITGKGFAQNTLVTISFDGSSIATTPSSVETNAIGSFNATFTVGSSTPGSHTVKATDLSGNSYSATFTITRKISLSSRSGGTYVAITVTGYSFEPNSNIGLTWSGSLLSTIPSSPVSDGTGYFMAIFTVPLDVVGQHIVAATDSASNTASDIYTVNPGISVTPSGLGVGDELWLGGTGYSGSSKITITWDGNVISTNPSVITTNGVGSFTASFVIPSCAIGTHRIVAVDQMMNSSSSSYTISSTSTVSVEMDVGTIYFRGEVAEFYALITQNGRPFDATATTARLFGPGGLVQDLSGAVTKIETGIFKIDYTVPGNAAPGTYALVVNASKTISGVSSFGSNIRAFEVSQTFGKMNATLTAINGSIASISLDTGPITLKLDQINASISSIISTSKGEINAQISTTTGIITSKLDLIGASISSIENRTAIIQTSLGSSNVDLATIDAKIDSLRGDMALVSSAVGALNVSLSNLNPELAAIKGNVLTLQTDLGALDVKLDDLEAKSIEVENGLVRIETEVGSIIMTLNNFTGIAIPVKTTAGLRMSTLFTDVGLTSVEYRESEQAISLLCNREPQSQGKISMVINKELLNLIGSSTSNIKLLVNGQETSFSILELPNAYILQTVIDQGPHQLVLYLNGLPSIFSNLWLYLYGFVVLGGLLVGGFFMMRRERKRLRFNLKTILKLKKSMQAETTKDAMIETPQEPMIPMKNPSEDILESAKKLLHV